MSRMSMADRMSLGQLHQAVQDGTLPAYIGIPMLQDKMQQQQQAQAGIAHPQQPPIAQQIMQQAQGMTAPQPQQMMPQPQQMMPQPQQGIPQLPSNLPEQGMAGGGIVAFASGGETEDDDEEAASFGGVPKGGHALLEHYLSQLQAPPPETQEDAIAQARAAMGEHQPQHPSHQGIEALQGTPQQSEQGVAALPAATQEYTLGKHRDAAEVVAAAEKYGVPPRLALHVLNKETGGLKNPDAAVSPKGAIGPMQLMPATAKALGVDPRNHAQNIDGGVRLLAELSGKFNDPRMVLAAYNAGEPAVRRAGGIPNFPETQNYVKGYAPGGIVSLAAGSKGAVKEDDYSEIGAPGIDLWQMVKNAASGIGNYVNDATLQSAAGEMNQPSLVSGTPLGATATAAKVQQAKDDQQGYTKYLDPREGSGSPTPATPNIDPESDSEKYINAGRMGEGQPGAKGAVPQGYMDRMQTYLDKRQKDIDADKERSKYEYLMNLGLGTMAGQSRHALSNIGTGGQFAAQADAANRKTQDLAQRSVGVGEQTMMHYGSVDDMRKLALAEKTAQNSAAQDIARAKLGELALQHAQLGTKAAQDVVEKAMEKWEDSGAKSDIEKQLGKDWQKDPQKVVLHDAALKRYIGMRASMVKEFMGSIAAGNQSAPSFLDRLANAPK